jgi:hypothetical protein
MEADNKELDKEVAEKLMSWRRMSVDTKNGSVEYWLGPKGENQMEPPAFSTDPAQAAKVAERLAKTKPLLMLMGLEPADVCRAALATLEEKE